ncbi:uncharacterized protein DUF5018 [Larkinella arboricola]|uniref:Uncharacterized protein DUF5018 n=1 Tax=Larkinella arboricola TaxID=643671 RepID=A0A327WQS9_LARAB|nr:DUF5018 domain-containing protein [Larkinella arboricola]RAJ93202.1 uncharacterized protein DUF5018 [Larkinella arboricola]
MKRFNLYQTVGCLFALLVLFSCEQVDLDKGVTERVGLLNFAVSIPGQSIEYPATKPGPYANDDTIVIRVPSTDENPLDLKRLKTFASLGHNSTIEPALGQITDFSAPIAVTVKDGDGAVTRHVVKVVPALPKTVFSKVWFKSSEALGIKRTNISGIAVVGEHLLVADFNGGNTGMDNGLRVLNKNTGELVKSIAPPTTYCMQVVADNADHFIVNRYNIYSAGFMVYYYENVDAAPKLILNYPASAGCPVNLGRKVSVIGNLKSGKAYVYATTNGTNTVYYWEFRDGVAVSTEPTVLRYASASPWTYAHIQRKSLDASSDHYLTYCNYNASDPNLLEGSRFVSFTPDMEETMMAKQNHYYKILGFNAFRVGGEEFTALLTQGYYAWDATHIKVFETNDPSKFGQQPGSAGYSDFMLFQSEAYGGTNYNRYGDLVADVRGDEVYLYATMATNAATNSGVMVYKMKYNKP